MPKCANIAAKVCAFMVVCTLFFGEFGCFLLIARSWELPPADDESLILLLFADPQIQGYYGEAPGILGFIARWDSDRYLQRVFALTMAHSKPDAVAILGDLFDEGYRASDSEFLEYKERFDAIFHTRPGLRIIHLAGDNDIGGEGDDMMTKHALQRFGRNFGPVNEIVQIRDYQFVKVNAVSFLSTPHSTEGELLRNETVDFISDIATQLDPDKHVIILSHAPLKYLTFDRLRKFVLSIKPICSFSGHTHKMMETRHSFHPDTFLSEITVPTCSYRMGTSRIGATVAVIGSEFSYCLAGLYLPIRLYANEVKYKHGSVQTKVLWLPERYWYFKLYGAVTLFTGIIQLSSSTRFRYAITLCSRNIKTVMPRFRAEYKVQKDCVNRLPVHFSS